MAIKLMKGRDCLVVGICLAKGQTPMPYCLLFAWADFSIFDDHIAFAHIRDIDFGMFLVLVHHQV